MGPPRYGRTPTAFSRFDPSKRGRHVRIRNPPVCDDFPLPPHDSIVCLARCLSSTITIRPNPMRLLSATAFLTLLVCAPAFAAAAPHQVDIPSANLTLHAQLYKPDGDGPFPTVIALHGCGGLGGPSEPVQPRYRDWAEQLLKAGHAVLLPDSYGSRERAARGARRRRAPARPHKGPRRAPPPRAGRRRQCGAAMAAAAALGRARAD